MTKKWYYVKDGETRGPVLEATLLHLVDSGDLRHSDLVYHEGLGQWRPIGELNTTFNTPRDQKPPPPAPSSPPPPHPTTRLPPQKPAPFPAQRPQRARPRNSGSPALPIGIAVACCVVALMAVFLFGRGPTANLWGWSTVTSANYNKIRTGMTESQVERILGKGVEQSSSSVSVPGVSVEAPGAHFSARGYSASAKVVTWENGMKAIIVTFSNGRVVGKGQYGL